jgi:hypothetical protein
MVFGRMICAEISFPKVQQEFAFYAAFLAAMKVVDVCPVVLVQPNPKLEFIGNSSISFGWAGFHCVFEAVKSNKAVIKFGFRIFAKYFHKKPCFRFCSGGPAHINPEIGQGLAARMIPTPHFHRVKSDGILWAYQTPPLLDTAECDRIVSDPQLGANLFCQEGNLCSPSGGFVVIKTFAAELIMSSPNNVDPLDGATFPP